MVHGNNERHVIIVRMIRVDAQTNRNGKHRATLKAAGRALHMYPAGNKRDRNG